MQCPGCGKELKEVKQQGVPVRFCSSCKGVWLEDGKINYLVQNPLPISQKLSQGLINEHESSRNCPACQKPMNTGGLLDSKLEVNRCPHCRGLFFDIGELAELDKLSAKVRMTPAERLKMSGISMAALAASESLGGKLPSLFFRSAVVLMFLYGIVFAFFFAAVEILKAPIGLAFLMVLVFAALQFLISPLVMDFMLTAFQGARFISSKSELPPGLVSFVEQQCEANKIPFPRMAVIEDGNPNAFTYGHTPKNARIVVTRGLVTLLNGEELNAVVAHELGHAIHWDMLIMTAAMLVPTFLYMIYRLGFKLASNSKAKKATKKISGQILIFAIVAFILYVVSEYVVLFLSRMREYYADRFSGVATNNPNALARGLVKIAYGLAGAGAKEAAQEQEQKSGVGLGKFGFGRLFKQQQSSVRALGIFNPGSARALAAVAVGSATRRFSAENLVGAMKWDLWSPWAGWYEFHSTHPLPAKRIQALGRQAEAMGMEPLVKFDLEKTESYWPSFLQDLFFYLLPVALPALLVAGYFAVDAANKTIAGNHYLAMLGIGFGLGYLARVLFSYRSGSFEPAQISELIQEVKVSAVRPVPATLKGTVIGRGIPGLIWSEDMVLQDETGFMFLDYRQPLRIVEFLFGLFRTKGLIGKEIIVKGWYRRAPAPWFEMKELLVDGKKYTCYVFNVKLIVAFLAIALGAALLGVRP